MSRKLLKATPFGVAPHQPLDAPAADAHVAVTQRPMDAADALGLTAFRRQEDACFSGCAQLDSRRTGDHPRRARRPARRSRCRRPQRPPSSATCSRSAWTTSPAICYCNVCSFSNVVLMRLLQQVGSARPFRPAGEMWCPETLGRSAYRLDQLFQEPGTNASDSLLPGRPPIGVLIGAHASSSPEFLSSALSATIGPLKAASPWSR